MKGDKTMKFNNETFDKISEQLYRKKKADPIDGRTIGMGVGLEDLFSKRTVIAVDGMIVCEIEELTRMIKELQMLKETIEEVTGLEL